MKLRLTAANANDAPAQHPHGSRLLEWLNRLTDPGVTLADLNEPVDFQAKVPATEVDTSPHREDWLAVAHICGYAQSDFESADAPLPLTAAAIEYFRRNHRGTENNIGRDFLTAQTDLPSPLAELYGLYLHRARIDVESALFLAQSTGAVRVARTMADLLAIGAFANGADYVSHLSLTYSIPAAFDTSAQIDRANSEAARRLDLPADHPAHLLRMTPDELGVLAASIAEKTSLAANDFLEKANLLAESRQDVTRLAVREHFATALLEGDLPISKPWVVRLAQAYNRVFPVWVSDLPDLQSVVH
jgi:hypothetical protein